MKQIVELNENDVKQAIADYVEKHIKRDANIEDVKLDVGKQLQGQGPMEYEAIVFKKAIVKLT